MQSVTEESTQEALHLRTNSSFETGARKESIVETLSNLALTPVRNVPYDGRLVLTSKESEFQVGRRNLYLLPQMMAYQFAEVILERMDMDEEEEDSHEYGSDVEKADGRRGWKDDLTAPNATVQLKIPSTIV